MRSLEERVRAFEQKKARLADVEAKLKLDEKKLRLRRCIVIGELAVRAGLADLDDEILYGAMLALAREGDAKRRQWSVEGAEALAAQNATDDREPVVLTFSTFPNSDTTSALRTNGFRYNRLLRHWEGLADFQEAQVLAEKLGGAARQVRI